MHISAYAYIYVCIYVCACMQRELGNPKRRPVKVYSMCMPVVWSIKVLAIASTRCVSGHAIAVGNHALS